MRPKDAYRTERDFAIRGQLLMRVAKRVNKSELMAPWPCWLLVGNDARERMSCESLEAAARLHDRYQMQASKIPELHGLVVSQDRGSVDYWIAPNGGVWSVVYLGKLNDREMATEPLKLEDLR